MANEDAETSKNLAANIANSRLKRSLTQGALARLAGLPRSTVTLLESGSANPSLSSLLKIAAALQLPLEELLVRPRARCQLVRADEVPLRRRTKDGVTLRKLLPDPLPSTEMDELSLAPGKSLTGAPHIAGTKEYLTCVRGTVRVVVQGESFDVNTGDVLAFEGDQPHAYHNDRDRPCTCVSVVVWAR